MLHSRILQGGLERGGCCRQVVTADVGPCREVITADGGLCRQVVIVNR